jgi:hypothetical protein
LTEEAQATEGEAQEAPAPKLGTPEYDQAMAEKFRAAKGGNSPFEAPTADLQVAKVDAPARPDNVPEKFWDAERGAVNTDALLKSYGELEGRQSKAPEVQAQETEAAAQEAVTKAGLNYETLAVKIAQTGKVDDADYAALGAAGITKDVVDSYIELVSYKASAEAEKAIAYVGGQEATDKLMKWAAANIPESEGAELNKLLAGPNWRVAIDAIKARQGSSSPTRNDPKIITGGSPAPGVTGFAARADMIAAMSDPRYMDRTSKGEKYRAEVARKAQVSAWNRK